MKTLLLIFALAIPASAQMPPLGNTGIQMPGIPGIGPNPVRIRDAQGRQVGTANVRSNGVIVVRDSRGRITSTATVRGGSITQRSTTGAKPKTK